MPMILPLAIVLSFPQAPQPPPPNAPSRTAPAVRDVAPPRLRIEPSGRVDLGSVGSQEFRERLYTFKNTSALPITLRVLDLSPGVTVQGPALRGPIAPGGAAELTLRADPSGFTGWQARNVKLVTDDPAQGEYYLPVAMTIRPDLTVDAENKSFGEVALHETPQTSFLFRSETGKASKLWISSPLPPYLEAQVESIPFVSGPKGPAMERSSETQGTRGAVRLTLRPTLIEPGVLTGLESLMVETSSPSQPRFQLYLDWRLRLPVKLSSPRIVFLDPLEKEKTLTILPRDQEKEFGLRALRLEGDGFRIPKVAPGSRTGLQLVVQRIASGPAKALLLLDLEGETLPLRIPISYLPPGKAKALTP